MRLVWMASCFVVDMRFVRMWYARSDTTSRFYREGRGVLPYCQMLRVHMLKDWNLTGEEAQKGVNIGRNAAGIGLLAVGTCTK